MAISQIFSETHQIIDFINIVWEHRRQSPLHANVKPCKNTMLNGENGMVKRSQKTNKKTNIHDNFFKKEIESNRDFSLCIFRKVFDPPTFRLFDWKTLKSEATAYIDHKSRPKMADFVFSVNLKGSGKKTDIVLLLEHKTGKGGDLLQQLLEYQTAIYSTRKNPIIPILVYQGPEKKWQSPLNF